MISEKEKWHLILQGRKEHFLYRKEPRDFEAAKIIREMQDLIEQDKVKDYSVLEDFGIDVTMPISKHQLKLT